MSLSASPLDVSPVIPVVVIDDPASAVPLARALVAGGVGIIEITLRTPRALDAVAAIAAEVPDIALGVGSILTPAQVEQALNAGADFLVSPGASPSLLQRLAAAPVPVLPGVATVSEVLTAVDHGLTELKFFPAGPAGGPAYLAVPGVAAVGGTWLTPKASIEAEDWASITALAAAAVATV